MYCGSGRRLSGFHFNSSAALLGLGLMRSTSIHDAFTTFVSSSSPTVRFLESDAFLSAEVTTHMLAPISIGTDAVQEGAILENLSSTSGLVNGHHLIMYAVCVVGISSSTGPGHFRTATVFAETNGPAVSVFSCNVGGVMGRYNLSEGHRYGRSSSTIITIDAVQRVRRCSCAVIGHAVTRRIIFS